MKAGEVKAIYSCIQMAEGWYIYELTMVKSVYQY